MISKDDDTHFLDAVNTFVDWCDLNFLELNISKTKEMLIDFRNNKTEPDPVILKVERFVSFNYLGATLDFTLSWTQNTDAIVSKTNTRLYCLRKLQSFNVNSHMLQLFFSSIVCNVLTFGSSVWGENITQYDRDRIERIIRKAGKWIGKTQESLTDMTEKKSLQKSNRHF